MADLSKFSRADKWYQIIAKSNLRVKKAYLSCHKDNLGIWKPPIIFNRILQWPNHSKSENFKKSPRYKCAVSHLSRDLEISGLLYPWHWNLGKLFYLHFYTHSQRNGVSVKTLAPLQLLCYCMEITTCSTKYALLDL